MSDLEYQSEFFNEATSMWEALSQRLADASQEASTIPRIPQAWARLTSINDVVTRVNELMEIITYDMLQEGSYVTQGVGETVREIGRDYFGVETEAIEVSRWVSPGNLGGPLTHTAQ